MLMDKNYIFLLDIKEPLLDLSSIPKKHEVRETTEADKSSVSKLDFEKDTNHVGITTDYLEVLLKILKKNKLESVILDVKTDYPLRARFGNDQQNKMIIAPRVE